MKSTLTKNSETNVTLTISVNAQELADLKKVTIKKLAKDVKVAGFRPGKVPANVAEKQLDQNLVNAQVAEDAVNTFAIEAITNENLQPLDRPQIEVSKYVPGESLEFKAVIEVLPEIKLGEYKKLKAKKESVTVTDTDVDEVVERLLASMATKEPVERAAKQGDEVVIDFEGKDEDGKLVPGASGQDYTLAIGSGTFIPGFEEGIIGKKAGDNFDLPLTFPKDYHHKPLAGAKVTFTTTLKEVREVKQPELNDEIAAKAGPFKTVDELKADVKRELTDRKEQEAVEKLKDSLLEQLVKGSKIPMPEVLVADQVANIERDFTQNLMYRGMTLQQYLDSEKLTREEWQEKTLRPQAERRVQVGLALAELSKVEKIDVSKEELELRLGEMMKQYGNNPEITKQLDTPEARRDLANRVMTEKTVDRLVELNK